MGAKLCLNPSQSEREPAALATTDAAGRFQLNVPGSLLDPKTSMPLHDLTVLATANGHGPNTASVREGEGAVDLELRLVKDDVPLVGRLLDLEGQPVVGAKISIASIRAVNDGDLTRLIQDYRSNPTFVWQAPYLRYVLQGPLTALSRPATSDAGGRFRITGIGRERLVELHYAAPTGIAHGSILAITRPVETITGLRDKQTIYGAEFRHLAQPSRIINGTLREKGSGKPLAGAHAKIQGLLHQAATTRALCHRLPRPSGETWRDARPGQHKGQIVSRQLTTTNGTAQETQPMETRSTDAGSGGEKGARRPTSPGRIPPGTCGAWLTCIAGLGLPPPGRNSSATWLRGPGPSIERLLKGSARSQNLSEDFTPFANLLAERAGDPARLKAWWMYRM
jgi:hypothetical protein